MGYKFEGPFKILNKGPYANDIEKRANAIGAWLPDMLSNENLMQATNWLLLDINGTAEGTKTAYGALLKCVKDHRERIVAFGAKTEANKGPLGRFLVEVLRCCNFATHSSATIASFRSLFADLGIGVTGQPQLCEDHATFANLDFDDSGNVVMEM